MDIECICRHDVISVDRSRTLQECATHMGETHVGTLLVTEETGDGAQAMGVVTDRDLVVRAMAHGLAPGSTPIGEIVRRRLVSVPYGATIDEAIEVMKREGIRRLLVAAADRRLVGIVSMDDLLDALVRELSGITQALHSGIARETEAVSSSCVLCGERSIRLPPD